MKLAACLTPMPHRTLLFLARERGLPLARNLSQRTLSRKLASALLDPAPLTALLASLPPAEMGLLRWLLAEGGSVPLVEATARYGPIRPYRPWRSDNPPDIGLPGVASSERLAYLGLVFVVPDPAHPKGPRALVLPAEYHPFLAPAPPVSQPAPPAPPAAATFPALLTDLALLLSLFHREAIRPQQHHWLPAAALRDLNARLTLPDPDPTHELHDAPRLRLLHFLAQAAALCTLTPAGFTVTDAGWQWLALPPPEQLHTLWHAFTHAPAPLWARFRLPAAPAVLPALWRALLYAPAPFPVAQFAHTLAQAEPLLRDLVLEWTDEADCTSQAAALLLPLLNETLPALGLLTLAGDHATLTPLAHWLRDLAPAPPFSAPAHFHLAPDGTLTVPAATPAPVLVQVEAIAEWRSSQGDSCTYALSEAGLHHALARGIHCSASVPRALHLIGAIP